MRRDRAIRPGLLPPPTPPVRAPTCPSWDPSTTASRGLLGIASCDNDCRVISRFISADNGHFFSNSTDAEEVGNQNNLRTTVARQHG